MLRFAPVLVLAWSLSAAEFARDVEPVLKRCQSCHGAGQQMAGLRVDDPVALKRVITPGKSADSLLYKRISSDKASFRMPPAGPPLTPEQIATIRTWIDAGAPMPASAPGLHWAFKPVVHSPVPDVRNRTWPRNPIDNFVLAKLESEGVEPSTEAAKTTLLRRASLDLTGLPPTPDEVAEFLNDNRPDAYERMVDRFLSSPHYGERWARNWLDLARYADSDGYEKDMVRPYAWRYRNWVIDALNRDMPFDQFTIEQLAGDLLPNPTVDQRVATGFHRNVLANREAGVDRAEARFEQMVNRTNTVGTVWLGLTVGCAQCHNHKYDPIPQRDYYRLMAFVNSVEESDIYAPMPGEVGPWLADRPKYEQARNRLLADYGVPTAQKAWEDKIRASIASPGTDVEWDFAVTEFRARLDLANKWIAIPLDKRSPRVAEKMTDYFVLSAVHPELEHDPGGKDCMKELKTRLEKLKESTAQVTEAMTVVEAQPLIPTRIATRGDFRNPGDEVEPGTLSALPPLQANGRATRLDLARWIVSRDNPLTARVAVNRMWQEFFGRGLVRTSEDFGTQGEKPTNPALLDWLAAEFMERGWSMKQMHRLIVTSAAYRQSSHSRQELQTRDPDNTLIARQDRLRLPAELIRDSALSAGGLLNDKIGGPSVRPPQPAGVAELGYAGSVKWDETVGPERYRRGLYIHFQRTTPYPMLMTFDAPDSNVSCTRRSRSNTPLQSLNLLNDPVFLEAAQGLARRTLLECQGAPADRIDYAFELALARKPDPKERQRLAQYLDQQASIFAKDATSAATVMPLDPKDANWVGLARVILNLDEFITRE